jgi:hypothetical protein
MVTSAGLFVALTKPLPVSAAMHGGVSTTKDKWLNKYWANTPTVGNLLWSEAQSAHVVDEQLDITTKLDWAVRQLHCIWTMAYNIGSTLLEYRGSQIMSKYLCTGLPVAMLVFVSGLADTTTCRIAIMWPEVCPTQSLATLCLPSTSDCDCDDNNRLVGWGARLVIYATIRQLVCICQVMTLAFTLPWMSRQRQMVRVRQQIYN